MKPSKGGVLRRGSHLRISFHLHRKPPTEKFDRGRILSIRSRLDGIHDFGSAGTISAIDETIADEKENEPDRSDIESDSRILTESRSYDYAGKEGHGDIAGVRSPRHLVRELRLFFFRERGTEFLLGAQDDEPSPERPRRNRRW